MKALATCTAILLGLATEAIAADPPAAPAAAAEPAVSAANAIRYRVRPGDTLPRLAKQFFVRGSDAMAVQRLNRLGGGRLRVGSFIVIPRDVLRTVPASARVAAFRGSIRLGSGREIKVGMLLGEGAQISTGVNSSISFGFTDKTTVTLPSQSQIRIERLRQYMITREFQRSFRLDAGRSQYDVTPSKTRGNSFQVRTPVSVAAVRGTQFRVAVVDDSHGAIAEVIRGNVGVAGRSADISLPAGYGAKSDETSTGTPVALLPAPDIQTPIERDGKGRLIFPIAPIKGAKIYRVQVAVDAAFLNIRSEAEGANPELHVGEVPRGTYFVRATAIDANGIEGLPGLFSFDKQIGLAVPMDRRHAMTALAATGGPTIRFGRLDRRTSR